MRRLPEMLRSSFCAVIIKQSLGLYYLIFSIALQPAGAVCPFNHEFIFNVILLIYFCEDRSSTTKASHAASSSGRRTAGRRSAGLDAPPPVIAPRLCPQALLCGAPRPKHSYGSSLYAMKGSMQLLARRRVPATLPSWRRDRVRIIASALYNRACASYKP